MWALRRASNPLNFRGLGIGASRPCGATSETLSCCLESKCTMPETFQPVYERQLSYHSSSFCSFYFMTRQGLSSQAGTESSESEDDSDDGFSELETPAVAKSGAGIGNEDDLISEPELSDDEDGEIEEPSKSALKLSDAETDSVEKNSQRKKVPSELFKAIAAAPSGVNLNSILDKWVVNGKSLDSTEIQQVMLNLRKRRLFLKALQLSEWLEANKQLEFTERDYASRVDLIAKMRGLQKAEAYIEKLPKSVRGEVIYRTLLANCVGSNNIKKAEEIFNKMKDLEFPITSFACNQLLLMYKRIDKKKIADVLLLMEKEDVKPSPFTYRILIDTKGQANDITGMDQIVETMKASGIEPDIHTKAIMAKHYVSGGLKEKAEAILKDMEEGSPKDQQRWACRLLLPLYAALGQADEVSRVWKMCESYPSAEECMAAVEAFGMLNKVDEAEAVFEKMAATWKKLSSRQYSTLLKVYANHKMLAKGKELIKRMADAGCRVGPLTWDALIRLHVEAGEVEKADSILNKAAQQNQISPMFNSYMVIMDQYSKKGDIHNAEKIFHRMRQAGYVARIRQFSSLIQAYINAKAPAYGMRERMKADNIFPNRGVAGQLALVDAFRKTAVSELLD